MIKLLGKILRKRAAEAIADYRAHLSQVRGKAPPLHLHLQPDPNRAWLDDATARPSVEFLRQRGFDLAGVYTIQGHSHVMVAGFGHPAQAIHTTLTRCNDALTLCFLSRFQDASLFEFTNLPAPYEQPLPEWLVRRRDASLEAPALLDKFLETRPQKPLLPAPVPAFARDLEADYTRYQTWLSDRGGATREELRARCQALEKLPEGADGERFLNLLHGSEIERSLYNWWRLQTQSSPSAGHPLEALVIIHDELPLDLLLNAYWCSTGDFKVKETDFLGAPPREAFARLVVSREAKLKRVLEKRSPIAADFYLPQ